MLSGTVDPRIKPGVRFQADEYSTTNDKGWVRFVGGNVSAKQPNAIYVGVEWDLDGRGKHDGALEGRRFFTCPPGRGAFIHPKRVMPGRPLAAGLFDRYLDQGNPQTTADLAVAAKVAGREIDLQVDFVGQEKVNKKLQKLDNLIHVTSSGAGISHVFEETDEVPPLPAGQISALDEVAKDFMNLARNPKFLSLCFPKVKALILDDNLFSSAEQLPLLLRVFPSLTQLSLSGNLLSLSYSLPESDKRGLEVLRGAELTDEVKSIHERFEEILGSETNAGEIPGEALRVLVLNGVQDAWMILTYLASLPSGRFKNLTEVHLCNTGLTGFPLDHLGAKTPEECAKLLRKLFPNLKLLNLSQNKIKSWDYEIAKFCYLPSLERLILNENLVQSISYTTLTSTYPPSSPEDVPFAKLFWLSIANNCIDDWKSIYELGCLPHLSELRIQDNLLPPTLLPSKSVPAADAQGDAASPEMQRKIRHLITALMPRLRVLNLSVVRPKERIDAEVAYVTTAWDEFKSAHPDLARADLVVLRKYLTETAQYELDATYKEAEKRRDEILRKALEVVEQFVQSPTEQASGVSISGNDSTEQLEENKAAAGPSELPSGQQSSTDDSVDAKTAALEKALERYPNLKIHEYFPRFKLLAVLHGSPMDAACQRADISDAIQTTTGASLKSALINLRLVLIPDPAYVSRNPPPEQSTYDFYMGCEDILEKSKKVPPSMTIGDMKSVALKLLKISSDMGTEDFVVKYIERSDPDSEESGASRGKHWELDLNDDMKTVGTQGLHSNGVVVFIPRREISE